VDRSTDPIFQSYFDLDTGSKPHGAFRVGFEHSTATRFLTMFDAMGAEGRVQIWREWGEPRHVRGYEFWLTKDVVQKSRKRTLVGTIEKQKSMADAGPQPQPQPQPKSQPKSQRKPEQSRWWSWGQKARPSSTLARPLLAPESEES
jgi:hypothetical protein